MLWYWLTEVAAPRAAKMPAVCEVVEASLAASELACPNGMAMPRTCAANVLSVPATLRSSCVTQASWPLHALTLAGMPLITAFTGVKPFCSWLTASAVPTTLLVNAAWTNPSAAANTTPSTMNTVTSVLALLDRTSHHEPNPVTTGAAPYPGCCPYEGCCPYPGCWVAPPCGSPG